MTDIQFANHGTIWLCWAETDAGRDWLEDNLEGDLCTIAGAVAIEPRYGPAIVLAMREDGLTVCG